MQLRTRVFGQKPPTVQLSAAIDADLHRKLKAHAVTAKKPICELTEQAIKDFLQGGHQSDSPTAAEMAIVRGILDKSRLSISLRLVVFEYFCRGQISRRAVDEVVSDSVIERIARGEQ